MKKILLLLLLWVPIVWAQDLELKKILVEFYKYEDNSVKLRVNQILDGQYPLYYKKNPKPAYLYFAMPAVNNDKLQSIFDQIMEALRFKDEESMTRLFAMVEKKYPNSPFLLTLKGRRAKADYEYEKAIQLLKEALKKNPIDDFAAINLSGIYRNMDDTNNALRYTILAIATNPLYKELADKNRFLFEKSGLKLKNRWYKPAWKKTGEGEYDILSSDWEYFVRALTTFSKLSSAQLSELSGISDPALAKYVLSFKILFHYQTLKQFKNKQIKKIRKIYNDGFLEPFILAEVLPYFPGEWKGIPADKVDAVVGYYHKYYLK